MSIIFYFDPLFYLCTLALNSRDRHDKIVTEFYVPHNTSFKKAILEESQLKCISDAIITLH